MSTLSLRLPDSMHSRLKEWARKDNVSINQFITSAVTEKLSALSTQKYLQERASRASRAEFDAALAKVPDTPPDEADRWQ
ncbi:MAG: type II toxin-antitoxin system HicB family antitoxin [Desulfobulbus sp.]|nr:type II toxin-antitoxin system HicB family antitoxin [Desulfobulbus sp.]